MSEENNKTVNESLDINKIKIRTILAQRFRTVGFKKVLAFILVAVIFFAAGIGTDRLLLRGRMNRTFNNRPNFQRRLPGNQNFNNQFKNNQNRNFNQEKPGGQ